MPQAIVTKFHGPTNKRGTRYSAKCDARRISVVAEDALDNDGNHRAAASQLIKALGWDDRAWVHGTPTGSGEYVWVPVLDYNTLPATRRKSK